MTTPSPTSLYDAYYFQHGCGLPYAPSEHWLRFFGHIADRIVHGIGPRAVLDAGCALGFLVGALRQRGVAAEGIDISEYAIAHAPEAARPYCRVGSVLDPLPQRYDLIVCIEVLEHMPPAESVQAVANLCRSTDDIIFSSSPIDFREATHFNVQPPEYWVGLFAEQGFVRDVEFDASVILPWSMRLRRTAEPLHRVVAAYERKLWRLSQENGELRAVSVEVRAQLAAYEQLQADHSTALRELEALRAIKATLAWKLAEALGPWRKRLLPDGSWRERWARRWVEGQGDKQP